MVFKKLGTVYTYIQCRQVTRGKAKSGAVVKHQWKLVVLKTTSNVNGNFKSGFAPLYRSLVTSLQCTCILYVDSRPTYIVHVCKCSVYMYVKPFLTHFACCPLGDEYKHL